MSENSTMQAGRLMSGSSSRAHRHSASTWVGLAAAVFSVLYFLSDVMELLNGGFTLPQLVLTYVSEAAIPVFVLGLYAAQRPHIGTLGLLGAVGYAYAYVFFTGTVLLALVNRPANWDALVGDLGPWVTLHGVLMVVAGTAFGVGVLRARVLPAWTGVMLMTGVLMVAVSSALPSIAQTISAGVRDLGFAGMGIALLMDARHRRQTAAPRRSTPHMSHTSPHLLAAANRAANKLMLPYLRSHAGRRAGRRLAVIEYDGRRSGERHELVTGYLRDGRTVRIRVGQAKDKTWWRNFSTPRPMDIRLAGENHRGTAHTQRDGDRVSVVVRLEG